MFSHQYFFPLTAFGKSATNLIADIYKIPGSLVRENNIVRVNLIQNKNNYSYSKDLSLAVQRINENAIYDEDNRRLIVKIIR